MAVAQKIEAPWTYEQFCDLASLQADPRFHGYTCPEHPDTRLSVAVDALICPDCGYRQTWA